ncbi:alpha-tectorin isoform X4 [Ictalurus punctatus]|uniref:Alpha-tectorin isoform X4 n=1 Tax=Ictalurus punctatus TaxID=7998 RepID=A0A9F7TQF2_ICTPU|nr:alpha-tectorin isoform X4 [Ictalurus punctatus]
MSLFPIPDSVLFMGCSLLQCLAVLLFMSLEAKGSIAHPLTAEEGSGEIAYMQPIITAEEGSGETTAEDGSGETTAEEGSGETTVTPTPPPASPFFDVGPGSISLYLGDGAYETIQLEQPFMYGGKAYTQLYLNVDGYLAFFVPNINDEVPNSQLGQDIISPLWTDLNFNVGEKKYEQATSGPLIDKANQEINRMFPDVDFSASWVFVATWENVPLEYYNTEFTSFQVVLASDGGLFSFILMNYGTLPYISPGYWLAGYGMEYSNFVTIPVNNAYELSSSSNVNIPGRWAFQFTAHCRNLNCASDEVCRQINGVYGCACGYITTQSPNIYDAIETCSGSTGSLSLSRCKLFEDGYSADNLHMNDQNCKGELQDNRLVFSFDSDVNTCGTTLKNNDTHVIFSNNVGTTEGLAVISRVGGLNINFSCVYPLIQSISMPTDIEAIGGVISKYLSTEGSYQITMIPYTDDTFQVPFIGNVTLDVNHQMYIAVQVDQFDSTQIGLVLDSCWATPFNQTDYSVRWDLISNECPNPNDGTVAVLQNGVSTTSYFSFRMFTFTGFSNKIYLHCQVHLCLLETGNCAQPCPGYLSRRRRAVDFYDSAAISMEF